MASSILIFGVNITKHEWNQHPIWCNPLVAYDMTMAQSEAVGETQHHCPGELIFNKWIGPENSIESWWFDMDPYNGFIIIPI